MVTYLDTSAWLKVYVREADHDQVEAAIQDSDFVASSIIAYAEARSGLARRMREGDFTSEDYADILQGLDADWSTFARLPVLESIVRRAGALAQRHELRGCDAVHLASALYLAERFDDLKFLAFDRRLMAAAEAAGIAVYPGPA